MPFWGCRLRYVPGGIFHRGGTQTNGGEIIERRCCLGGIAFALSPPESTSWADGSNAGELGGRKNRPLGRTKLREALRRRRRRCVSPLRNSPSRRKRKRRPHIKKKKSPLLRSRHGYFPGAAGRTRGEIPSRAKNLIEALAWRSRPGCFSGGSDHEGGENTSGGRKSSTSCHVGSVATVIFSA